MDSFFGPKLLKADNTSFEEDLNWLYMLSLVSLINGLPKRAYIYIRFLNLSVAAFNSSLASCSCKTQFAEGSIASSELRVASTRLEIREWSRGLVWKARLSFAT